MRKIAVLDQQTIDKIAAGEVVERPSSIVKELVENAIDAGATAVTVEITDGGKKMIRITDNGGGMERDQVPLAFLRHATSKIEKVEDLEHIASLGFRGEALSSIAAVAQVELITKTPSALSGVRYVINGGVQESLEDMGAPEGTTFLVRNLFYNTPARSKFLKSDTTEGNYVSTLMEQLALSHPEISFKYIQNKQVKLHTSGNYNIKDVIYNIYGRDITKALLEVSYENDFMKIEGFVGKPEISRGNRTFENYYINGRFVKNRIIAKGIEDAYKGFLMQHKFPFVSLHIQMEGNDLDVNVHPSKMEVRFARGTEVYDAVYETVHKALTTREMIQTVPFGKEESVRKQSSLVKPGDIPEPFEMKRRAEMPEYRTQVSNTVNRTSNVSIKGNDRTVSAPGTAMDKKQISSYSTLPRGTITMAEQAVREQKIYQTKDPFTKAEEKLFEGTINDKNIHEKQPDAMQVNMSQKATVSVNKNVVDSNENAETCDESAERVQEVEKEQKPQQLELFEEKLLAPESRSRHQLIGQIFDTYWLVQFEDRFFIIDQHAAHEKVYYERFVKRFREQTIESQYLSPPLIVSLNLQEEALLETNRKYFEDFGFEIEPFGGKEYCINAVPTNLYGLDEEELFLEMLDNLASEKDKDPLGIFASRLATMACKAAVKGNHQMSVQEANMLIDELLTLDNPYHCPHGRPTIISMTKTELEKKFKRIV
ncbi:DNA mismatch repair endonuclease MutL [Ruminococcus sp. AM30-15AC]|mgnify:FL=1|nr:DNA mismatch repair endonuclease MutL [Ruminococcus sp. AF13-37]RGW22314.1 DNA mismatch repair endonuclease MutL [Ruminococcus sp. AF13-28]RGY91079.1 DNA mismatch repair endonuclease MutL [Ruminococcus sp. AM58-7XD]RHD93851.1 DNA mismatch repair endonuclease MutL [Ruminococcus sp. AM30-15AC]RHO85959.1 DNA mismatch repair endonuclease MutL [Ruminococcus sp. AF42-9BH]RHQ63042.1 DNA mismatch repair endonuclease MutL [Ruminococcus sp. AF24-32LB]RHQ98511.1 DNA mismatch repair endonuclease MutL 